MAGYWIFQRIAHPYLLQRRGIVVSPLGRGLKGGLYSFKSSFGIKI